MTNLIKPDVFNYTDYRMYLRDVADANNATDLDHSLTGVSDYLSKDFLITLIDDAEASLSIKNCILISTALAHTDEEAAYFGYLVALSQASHDREINCLDDLRRLIADRNRVKTEMVDRKREDFYAQWYHSAVRALVGTINTSEDITEQLAKKLLVPVSENQIQQSLELLLRLGFIKKDGNGDFSITTEKNIKTGQDFSWEEKKRIHLEYLKLAGNVLSEADIGPTKVSSHVIGISHDTFNLICTYTDELKKRIGTLVENEEKTERVYLYQLVFVPLTKDGTTR